MKQTEIIEQFHQGKCLNAYQYLGAHFIGTKKSKVRFRVYAPHAKCIYLIGSFNDWNQSSHPMSFDSSTGVWEITVSGAQEWDSYKYHILGADDQWYDKADPYAFYGETRPDTASKLVDLKQIRWTDQSWMRKRNVNFSRPLNIYEVYAGGWKRNEQFPYNYHQIRDELIPYVKEQGFTHIEFMPLNEHPFDGSWGYQASGYFSLTSRYGNPVEFAQLVDACHNAGIGVIMDFVPAHFVKDAFGLCRFDGTALYEYPDAQDAESEWGTYNFDLWKEEVRSFLMSAAAFWCDIYHVDGLRFDAVSNLIFWGGNKDRGVNQGALDFVKRTNHLLHQRFSRIMLIAEDSSDYQKVTAPTFEDGLGFDYKWDLGWMNDTLRYYELDPIYRSYHHNRINFSMFYFYSERFLLPLSHDENVHGKKTVIDRMWGNYDEKFSQVKNLYGYMYAHPGKQLNFMGNELASFREFDEIRELDWKLLEYAKHQSFARYFRDLNFIYQGHDALWKYDYDDCGFRWIDADNAQESVFSFYRESDKEVIVCILNMLPKMHENFRLCFPYSGCYTEILNSEKDIYGGCNACNYEPIIVGDDLQATVRLAPFSAVWFLYQKPMKKKLGAK